MATYFETPGGALVVSVQPGSMADLAGLRAGDVILRARDVEFPTAARLVSIFSLHRGVIPVKVAREKKRLLISINVGSQQQSR